jgi:predicted regulator of Ras-like GTPase activity (Roadblock/LC7/MglB family)
MGFICFRQGRLAEAERYLSDAAAADPGDASIASALAHVRRQLAGGGASAAAGGPPREQSAAERPDERHPGDDDDILPPRPTVARAREQAAVPGAGRDARTLFADVIGDGEQTVLLLDAAGLVLAGAYVTLDQGDVAQEVGAELSGVSEEAQRAMRHLDLGNWTSIVFETEVAIVAMAPAQSDGLLLVAAERATPLGFVRRLLDRAAETAHAWLGVRR